MRVALVSPKDSFLDSAGDRPYLGNLYLAGYARKHTDAEIGIFDLNHDTLYDVINFGPDVVGIGFTTPHYHGVVQIAKSLRSSLKDSARIIAGGAHPTAVDPYQLLKDKLFDQVVQGEGEIALTKIINGDRSPVLNEPYIRDIDTIPMPAWDLIDMSRYTMDWDGNKATTLFSSRGCTFCCSFCSKDIWGRTFRSHSPERVVDEMDFLFKNYGISNFYFYDDTFTIDRKRVYGMIDELQRRGRNYRWKIITRADTVQPELLHDMYVAGYKEVSYGIEHGDNDSLDRINKGMTVQQNVDAVRWAQEAGMKVKGFFIIGLPGDTPEKIKDTVQLAKDLNLDHALFSVMMPYPGTDMYLHPEKYGIKLDPSIQYGDWLQYAGYNTANYPTTVMDIGTMPRKRVEKMAVWAKSEWERFKHG